jgi:hypothetical protein
MKMLVDGKMKMLVDRMKTLATKTLEDAMKTL